MPMEKIFYLILIITLLLVSCEDDDSDQVSQPPDGVEQKLSKFSLVRMLEGRTKWKLSAEVATFLELDRVRIEDVELLIFGDKDGETLTIYGDQGEINQRTNDIKITGNVKGVSSDNGVLNTEEIYWRDRAGKIYTLPGIKVTITYEDSVIVGEELEADPELETARLRNMTGITRTEEKESDKSAD